MNLYVFGNGNLSFQAFRVHYVQPLSQLALGEVSFLVGDFRGVDTLAMEWLKDKSENVTVFHVGKRPRYFPDRYKTKVDQWEQAGEFASDEDRDGAAMTRCSHFLAVDQNSDETRRSGTLRNIERLTQMGKTRLT